MEKRYTNWSYSTKWNNDNPSRYHSDDGFLYNSQGYGKQYGLPYGLSICEDHIVGCGYDDKKKELFFTRDGIKLDNPIHIETDSLSAAIGISDFTTVEINYGNKPFAFDLVEEYHRNGYLN